MKAKDAESQAEIRLDMFKEFRGKVFCPLIDGNCVEGCECEGKPTVVYFGARDQGGVPVEPDRWDVMNWRCENAMFSGVE